jgi:hypothetical protein
MSSAIFCILFILTSTCFKPAELLAKPGKADKEKNEKSNLELASTIDSFCIELDSTSVQNTTSFSEVKSLLDSSIIHALRLLSEFHNTKHEPPRVDLGNNSITSKIMDISFQSLVQASIRKMEQRGDLSVADAYRSCTSRIMANIRKSDLTQPHVYEKLDEYFKIYLQIYQLLTDPKESYASFGPKILQLQNESGNLSDRLDKVLH